MGDRYTQRAEHMALVPSTVETDLLEEASSPNAWSSLLHRVGSDNWLREGDSREGCVVDPPRDNSSQPHASTRVSLLPNHPPSASPVLNISLLRNALSSLSHEGGHSELLGSSGGSLVALRESRVDSPLTTENMVELHHQPKVF